MKHLARLGALLLVTMGMVVQAAPPASSATQVGVILVVGTATVGPGIGYPCVGGGPLAPFDPKKCPPGPIYQLAKIITGGNPAQPPPPPNVAGVTFVGNGVGAEVVVGKKPCQTTGPTVCVEAGLSAIVGVGGVTGYCGLSTGFLNGTIATTAVPPVIKGKVHTFAVTFTGVGGLLILSGTTTKGETITGAVAAIPTGGSCTNKLGKTFTVAGPIVVT